MATWINKAGVEIELTDRDQAYFELMQDLTKAIAVLSIRRKNG